MRAAAHDAALQHPHRSVAVADNTDGQLCSSRADGQRNPAAAQVGRVRDLWFRVPLHIPYPTLVRMDRNPAAAQVQATRPIVQRSDARAGPEMLGSPSTCT